MGQDCEGKEDRVCDLIHDLIHGLDTGATEYLVCGAMADLHCESGTVLAELVDQEQERHYSDMAFIDGFLGCGMGISQTISTAMS